MTKHSFLISAVAIALLSLVSASHALASQTDKVFAGKVSQGGLYEVLASQLAEQKATAPDVKDLATTEVHDHTRVNSQLKKIAMQSGISLAPGLNSEFRQRLAALKSVPETQFDAAYLSDMQKIHDKDEKLFAQEATAGSPLFKTFAHQTDLIVKRHIGALHGLDKESQSPLQNS